ncbi:MAG: hypothetical protein ABI699_12350 [Caldimonas sp.]
MTQASFSPRGATLTAIAVATALVGALASTPLFAAGAATRTTDKSSADARYVQERADCEAGRTAEDKATCLKEAGAALVERRRNTLDNSGSPMMNATDRCNVLPAKDKASCLARVLGPATPNTRTTTSGSVSGGGVIKETTTTTPGAIIILTPAPTPSPASAP